MISTQRKDALDHAELEAWFSLLRAPQLGARRLSVALQQQPAPVQLCLRPPDEWPSQTREAVKTPDRSQIEKDIHWLNDSGCQFLPFTSTNYPEQLKVLHDPPPALFLRGNAGLLDLPQIAIVGSRSTSQQGLETAKQFAQHLAEGGFCITSGLALGIDSAAHQGALTAKGKTIAVLGTGLDRVYPARNHDLAHQIAETGLLVSEYLPDTPPLPQNFPRRNRIIAGLSLGTLVVEAALKSGSLITARLASELGREVFAIPGSIHKPTARGCHQLIRDGAKLVETAEHIFEELGGQLDGLSEYVESNEENDINHELEADYQELLDLIGFDPVTIDQLVIQSRFSAAEISSMLLLLELQGHVLSESGGLFSRTGKMSSEP